MAGQAFLEFGALVLAGFLPKAGYAPLMARFPVHVVLAEDGSLVTAGLGEALAAEQAARAGEGRQAAAICRSTSANASTGEIATGEFIRLFP